MADNKDKRTPEEEKPPEDFRPFVPEPELRRSSIYKFSKNYPQNELPISTHRVSFAQQELKHKVRRNVLYCLVLLLVFSAAFVVTGASIKISKEPLPATTAAPTVTEETTTQAQTQPSTEEVSEESSVPETQSKAPTRATTKRTTTKRAESTAPATEAQTTNVFQALFNR